MKHEQTGAPLLLFYSYAHEDEPLCEQLEKHLRLLSRQGLITEWHNRKLLPGTEWAQEIDSYLETASIVLLLVSSDFLASDYCYEMEMQRALERHKQGMTRVIPVILRPCEWQKGPFAHLQCLPHNGQPVTMWNNQDEAFLNITQGLRQVIEQVHLPAHPLPPIQKENRERLIKRVRTTWIEGFLEQSLHQAIWLDLGLQDQPDALDNPWDVLVQEMDTKPRPLPAGTSIVQVYDQADGKLLILGQPGSGKTTLLLQLTRTLLERAERDTHFPLPVVFVLSSWAQKRRPLAVWLVEELKLRYHVPPTIAEHWIKEQQILPLLDGLDEIAPNARAACVQAVNTYIDEHNYQKQVPLVVSCRSQEYADLSTRVALQKAVSILPMSKEQIEKYLQRGGKRVEGIRRALAEDTTLAEMARTPLLLSVFVLAYIDVPLADLPLGLTREEFLRTLFATYIKRMLFRRGLLRSGNPKQALERLAFLAQQMQHYNQTIFTVESLQADGLSRWQEFFYLLSYPLRNGLLFLLVVGLPSWLGDSLAEWQSGRIPRLSDALGRGIYDPGLAIGIIIGFFALLVTSIRPIESIITIVQANKAKSTSPSPANTLIYRAESTSSPPANRSAWIIQPKEVLTLNWSWANIRLGLIWGLAVGLTIGLISTGLGGFFATIVGELVISRLILSRPRLDQIVARNKFLRRLPIHLDKESGYRLWEKFRFGLISLIALGAIFGITRASYGPTVAIIIGLPVWMFISVMRIASGSLLLQRTHLGPNEGIRRSGKNGLILGLIVAIALTLPLGLTEWLFFRTPMSFASFGLIIGLTIGLSFGLFFGLEAFFQHFTLRFWLWLLDRLPWSIVSFLDEMVERILLRKVGGSYIFVHRFLLDYISSLTPAEQAALSRATRTRTHTTRFHNVPSPLHGILNKRLVVALIALVCVFLPSFALVTHIQTQTKVAMAKNATATALFSPATEATIGAALRGTNNLIQLSNYPSTFPGHGLPFLISAPDQPRVKDLMDDQTTECYTQKDGYHALQKTAGNISLCGLKSRRSLSGIAIQVQMNILRGDCGGFTFRSDLVTRSGYTFSLCEDGTYSLAKDGLQASSHLLIPPTLVPGGIQRTNTYAAVALGSTITLFVNGQQIASIEDKQYTQGDFSFVALATHNPTEVVYNTIQVWKVGP